MGSESKFGAAFSKNNMKNQNQKKPNKNTVAQDPLKKREISWWIRMQKNNKNNVGLRCILDELKFCVLS